MSHGLDLPAVAAALKAHLATELFDLDTVAYDPDEVPGAVRGQEPGPDYPTRHVEISLNRDDEPANETFDGDVDMPAIQLRTLAHSTSIANTREIRRRVGLALEGVALTLTSGVEIGPIAFDFAEPEDDDDTGWRGVDHWTLS